ncbi:hypothetical protein [uncultured Sneathiella sp.]|uniref:hypothetical protein n=1 Tax=uncultured Sneathiella sp. TaxID=879315 RepID=UPI0030D7F8F8|tara:strand:- start:1106 stop:1492 length:387 start_codon:yes stop_codon:yes gene_type:complete
MSEQDIEVYRQRYETFRHFDRLRWQMLQLLIAVVSAAGLVSRASSQPVGGWLWVMVGLACLIIAFVMFRVSSGMRGNNVALMKAGARLGDEDIPDLQNGVKSFSFWLTVVVGSAGCISILYGLATFCP